MLYVNLLAEGRDRSPDTFNDAATVRGSMKSTLTAVPVTVTVTAVLVSPASAVTGSAKP